MGRAVHEERLATDRLVDYATRLGGVSALRAAFYSQQLGCQRPQAANAVRAALAPAAESSVKPYVPSFSSSLAASTAAW